MKLNFSLTTSSRPRTVSLQGVSLNEPGKCTRERRSSTAGLIAQSDSPPNNEEFKPKLAESRQYLGAHLVLCSTLADGC